MDIFSLYIYWGTKSCFPDKRICLKLINNIKVNYWKTSKLPKTLIFLMIAFNKNSPLAKFRIFLPTILLGFVDKLFFMHLSYVLEHGLLEVPPTKVRPKENQVPIDSIYDYIIIGSGPGAGVAALALPEGKKILILEKGGEQSVKVELKHTLANMILDFTDSGMQIVWGRKFINISQGETLGGGSEINSGLYKKLEQKKRTSLLGILSVADEDFSKAEQSVEKLLNPIFDSSIVKEESLLYRGGTALGIPMAEVPRWRSRVKNAWVNNSIKTLLWDQGKYQIKSNFQVVKIEPAENYLKVVGFDLDLNVNITLKGRKIIMAAGTTGTPLLLKESNLIKAKDIEFNFAPMIRVFAKVNKNTLGGEDIDPFQGYDITRGFKYGSGVSTASLLSGLLGELITPEQAKSIRSYYVSFLSNGSGGMLSNGAFYYNFSRSDMRTAKTALTSLKSLVVAGGGEIIGVESNDLNFSSVHIFGSLPYGSDLYQSNSTILKLEPRICVVDGSILPFAPEINPQALVMVTAKIVIERAVLNGF